MPAKRKSPGRPRLGMERRRDIQVTLPPKAIADLRAIGEGSVSGGIIMALIAYQLRK